MVHVMLNVCLTTFFFFFTKHRWSGLHDVMWNVCSITFYFFTQNRLSVFKKYFVI